MGRIWGEEGGRRVYRYYGGVANIDPPHSQCRPVQSRGNSRRREGTSDALPPVGKTLQLLRGGVTL